jgi:ABC-2 type transport system ATP-binding protein
VPHDTVAGVERLIAVDALGKRWGARVALDHVSFAVGAGETVALLGPNGAGKSTTLAILASLVEPDAGTAEIAGAPLPDGAARARAQLGYVPQRIALYPTLTARENLLFFARMQGLGRAAAAQAAARVLEMVALDARADEPVREFSGGMQRRLNLAGGILHQPRVVLLDEPTVGVDPQSRERIHDGVRALAREGAAILYSTHDMAEAERVCDRVVLLDGGVVVAEGTPAELVSRSGMTHHLRVRTSTALPAGWLAGVDGARLVAADACEATVALDDPSRAPATLISAARAGGEVLEFALHRPNLADVFFTLTGRALRDDGAEPPTLH